MPPVFGPSILVEDALVILGGQQRHGPGAVRDDEERHLRTDEALLEDEPRAGIAELGARPSWSAPLARRFAVRRNDDALAGGETVRLQRRREAELASLDDVEAPADRLAHAVARRSARRVST